MQIHSTVESARDVVLAVHGGAGSPKKKLLPEVEREIHLALAKALGAGYTIIKKGGSSIAAVEAAVRVLEDDHHFNAGRGSVFTADGRNELDASIMEGLSKKAGSVAGLTHVKNPISAARAVMEKSEHVFLMGRGAEEFAKLSGLEMVKPKYFWTQRRWNDLLQWRKNQKKSRSSERSKRGTVGAVAIDRKKTMAAGTSTGGMTGKRFGRVGDSPVIGAGTYADNSSGAVSATGWGEYFIRYAVASNILARVKYLGELVEKAADSVINGEIQKSGGDGGVIVLDRRGRYAAALNTTLMYRGYITKEGEIKTAIYDR